MNIIYINHYAGSQIDPEEWRPYYLSKGFIVNGCSASVICASYHHLQKNTFDQSEYIYQKKVDEINFRWLRTPNYTGNGISRIKNMLSFGWQVLTNDPVVDLKLGKPDLIIASSAHPFHLIGAIRWAKKYDAKVFYEVRDVWPLSLNKLLGLSKFHPFSILLKFFQYIGLKFTDKTIALAKNLESYFLQHGLAKGKFLYVCNGIDEEQPISSSSTLDEKLEGVREHYNRIIMYTGSHGIPNALDIIIHAMNEVEDNSIALVLIGSGDQKNKLEQLTTNQNIIFLDSVPKNQVQRVLSYADICIISWQDIELYKYGVSPNKIFDYMFAKKPIIQSLNCPQNQVEESGCGLNIEAVNIPEMKSAILAMCSKTNQELRALGQKGHSYVLENFEYKQLAKKIINEVGSIKK
jgi:hypothetical protein